MLGHMWIRSLDLDKAFRTDGLFTTACGVQIWRIIEEADRTFRGVFIEKYLNRLSINKRIMCKLEFPRR